MDCSGGQDESGCLRYARLFAVEPGFKLASSEEGFANTTEEECARMCVQSKVGPGRGTSSPFHKGQLKKANYKCPNSN